MRGLLDRMLSLGQSDAIPEDLARHGRITNALAALGCGLSLTSVPIDAAGAQIWVLVIDIVAAAMFAGCWVLNARGHHHVSRVVLMVAAHGVMMSGVVALGGVAELRTVFFPLAILPFLVFSMSERGWLIAFSALSVITYFVTAQLEPTGPSLALSVYKVYAPLLSFATIVIGTAVFAYINRSAEENLMLARARAAQGARLVALGEMSSGIAHEIRNPLAAIHLAATQIAERPDHPAQVKQLGERIQRIVMRASRIIDALRSFARDASGDPFVAAPVERIIGDAVELCGKRFAEHGVALTVSAVPPELVVECRAVQLSQVLVNLLGNAYDAVGFSKDRWVRVDAKPELDQLEIAVTDSGPGIPDPVRLRLFEPFFTTKAPDRGTGLGLSLSRGLVQAHHGTLELDSQSPHTRFVIRIPLRQPTT